MQVLLGLYKAKAGFVQNSLCNLLLIGGVTFEFKDIFFKKALKTELRFKKAKAPRS
jgi:hypothetical protein